MVQSMGEVEREVAIRSELESEASRVKTLVNKTKKMEKELWQVRKKVGFVSL